MRVSFSSVVILLPLLFVVSFAASLSKMLSIGVSNEQPYPLSTFNSHQYHYAAQFSQAAFCDPQPRDSILGATVYYRAGDGRDVPTIFIAHHAEKGIILSNQGTNKTDKSSIMNDLQLNLVNPDGRFSSCLDKDSDVHHGFQETWQHTANEALSQIQVLLHKFPDSPILVTGHSLGAAVSTIYYVFLRCKLPNAKVSAILFGSPRVGDVNFANSIDRLASNSINSFTRIVNGKDSVPHLPPRALTRLLPGYWHPKGEVWIKQANGMDALVCPGQENSHCSDQYHLYETQWSHHSGWYFGVNIHGNFSPNGCQIVHHIVKKTDKRLTRKT